MISGVPVTPFGCAFISFAIASRSLPFVLQVTSIVLDDCSLVISIGVGNNFYLKSPLHSLLLLPFCPELEINNTSVGYISVLTLVFTPTNGNAMVRAIKDGACYFVTFYLNRLKRNNFE
jgi:hypothetical protein